MTEPSLTGMDGRRNAGWPSLPVITAVKEENVEGVMAAFTGFADLIEGGNEGNAKSGLNDRSIRSSNTFILSLLISKEMSES
jgi:hypothetical protein